jgi:hypothetical protein
MAFQLALQSFLSALDRCALFFFVHGGNLLSRLFLPTLHYRALARKGYCRHR